MTRVELEKGIVNLREPLRKDKNLMEVHAEYNGVHNQSLYLQKAEELLSEVEDVAEEHKKAWLNSLNVRDARTLRTAVIKHFNSFTLSEGDKKK